MTFGDPRLDWLEIGNNLPRERLGCKQSEISRYRMPKQRQESQHRSVVSARPDLEHFNHPDPGTCTVLDREADAGDGMDSGVGADDLIATGGTLQRQDAPLVIHVQSDRPTRVT